MKEDLRSLSDYEIALICSNLARGCEKQYLFEEQKVFLELAKHYEDKELGKAGTLTDVKDWVVNDIAEYNHAFEIVGDDRGAKRVLTWSSKVTTLTNIILDNYAKKGLDYLKNTKIWVCDICGFVFIGDVPPEVCPICKVPSFKILEVK